MIEVNTVYKSIQGEGAMTGVPMIVLRLMGCGVGCRFCDTKETWDKRSAVELVGDPHEMLQSLQQTGDAKKSYGYAKFIEQELARMIQHEWPVCSWVLVTGGEPSEQPLGSLVKALHDYGKQVAIETSGTARGHLTQPFAGRYETHFDWVCVSPKFDNPNGVPVLRECIRTADELKFVVGKVDDVARAARFLHENEVDISANMQISVQPMSQSESATKICIDAAMQYDWRLSLQTHKFVGLP